MRNLYANGRSTLPLGRMGENEATVIVFNIAEWRELFGNGTFSLVNLRPGDAAAYPCVIEQDATTVKWTVQSADLAKQGYGKCELIYTVGGTIAKSEIYTTFIGEALTGGAEPPEPWEDWVQRVLASGAAAQEAKQAWENMSAVAATLPPGSDATASYTDGVLLLGIPKGEAGEGATTWGELTDKPFNTIGENLKVVGGVLSVDTAPNVQQDNTKPITSAAVYTEVGNINALLALI